jgi:hypothetical protein
VDFAEVLFGRQLIVHPWWGPDSNRRRTGLKAGPLPIELRHRRPLAAHPDQTPRRSRIEFKLELYRSKRERAFRAGE